MPCSRTCFGLQVGVLPKMSRYFQNIRPALREGIRQLLWPTAGPAGHFGSISTFWRHEFRTQNVFWNTACSKHCCFYEAAMFRTCGVLENASDSKCVFSPNCRDSSKLSGRPRGRVSRVRKSTRVRKSRTTTPTKHTETQGPCPNLSGFCINAQGLRDPAPTCDRPERI